MKSGTVFLCALSLTLAVAFAHDPKIHTSRENGRSLPLTKRDDVFHFVIYGDRTGGPAEGIKVLEDAVEDTNLLDPDFVMTVGDLVQGYNEPDEWMKQMEEFRGVMDDLKMPWFPVAGNHDIYWRSKANSPKPPPQEHEDNYEKHFGPLWYWFAHKKTGFLVLYTDEGPSPKGFSEPEQVQMSDEQLKWLEKSLSEMSGLQNVFVFLHHPRWIGGNYSGSNWDRVHAVLAAPGNVRAVFAGHIHRLRYDGEKDGIGYYALATTGGAMPGDYPIAGYVHHLNVVTVRKNSYSMSILPVGAVIDPKDYTPKRLAEIDAVRKMPFRRISDPIKIRSNGDAVGIYSTKVKNPGTMPVELVVTPDIPEGVSGWVVLPDHQHVTILPDGEGEVSITYSHTASENKNNFGSPPGLYVETDYLDGGVRAKLPARRVSLDSELAEVAADFFETDEDLCLEVAEGGSGIRVHSDAFELPDGPFTLECLAKPAKHLTNAGLLAKTENSEFAFFVFDGKIKFEVFLDGSYKGLEAPAPLAIGEWSHLAGVYDGKAVSLFINGERVGMVEASGERKTNRLPLYIGADPDGSGKPTRSFMAISGTRNEPSSRNSLNINRYFSPP
jgi:hypothetical protein